MNESMHIEEWEDRLKYMYAIFALWFEQVDFGGVVVLCSFN